MNYQHLKVEPVSGALGAEVQGINLSSPMDGQVFGEVEAAFAAHQVLFFRDQDLSTQTLAAFAGRFGTLCIPAYGGAVYDTGHPSVTAVERNADAPKEARNAGDEWHSDQAPREMPSKAIVLYCLEAPAWGGDTQWANLHLAYDALSDRMKAICEQLTVIHAVAGMYGDGTGRDGKRPLRNAAEPAARKSLALEAEHPLVRVHPDTGRKLLYVTGSYSTRFGGMTAPESRPLLDYFNALAAKPEHTCRFRWKKGSLALWDNRCTLHYAIQDYAGSRRSMIRAEVEGDRPFGPAMQAGRPGRPR